MRHAGADWIKTNCKTELSKLGENVANLLGDLYQGIYHISGPALHRVDWTDEHHISLTLVAHRSSSLATYDFDDLTALVVLSHDRCIRITIEPCSFRNVRLTFHPRDREGSSISNRMPTLEDHVDSIRKRYVYTSAQTNV